MILSLHVPRYRSYGYEYNEIGVIVHDVTRVSGLVLAEKD
jgi:hypothetical protein